jgi:integrase
MYHAGRKKKKIHADLIPGEFIQRREVLPRRLVTDEEFKSLCDHAKDPFMDILICGYETAMRSSEICRLTAGQVHLDMPVIVSGQKRMASYSDLGIFDTKTGARRTVPVSAPLKEILERRLQGLKSDDLVFTGHRGKAFKNVDITGWMTRTCESAKIPYGDKVFTPKGEKAGIVFHCLRHTRTSCWVLEGFSDEIIRRATGHASLKAYQTYVKLEPSVVMRLVENSYSSKTDKNGIKTAETHN